VLEPVDLINKKWFARESNDRFAYGIDHGYEVYAQHEEPGQYYQIANDLTKEVAEHIVEVHNSWYSMKALGDGIKDFFDKMTKSINEASQKLKEDMKKA